jgi:ribosomal protein L40E
MKRGFGKAEKGYVLAFVCCGMMLVLLMLGGGRRFHADQVYGYLLPNSSYTYLDESAVAGWPAQVVCYAKNEIYARNGRRFVSNELQNWFNMQYWYTPIYTPEQFSDSMLNAYETANVQMLSNVEASLGMYALDGNSYSYDLVRSYLSPGGGSQYYVNPDTYIFYDSDSRYLTDSDLSNLSAQELCYAKNEIYARRGYIFASTELSDYFNAKNWYWGTNDASTFSDSVFNSIEVANVSLLQQKEFSLVPGGYVLDQPGYTYQNIGSYSGGYVAQATSSDYIIYDSAVRYLSEAEVSALSLQQMCYARNEIYARRGYIFQSQELRDYFGSKSWYYPTVPAQSFSDQVFNSVEIANIDLLKRVEYSINPNGYQLY